MTAPGESFQNFANFVDNSPNKQQIEEQMRAWMKHIESEYSAANSKLGSGKFHKTIKVASQDTRDLRFTIPKSKHAGKTKQDGQGLAKLLVGSGVSGGKMTVSWVVCYLNGKRPRSKLDECSHRCCDYDEQGQRLADRRCIDPDCLTWESKSLNQSRANPSCHKLCHCGCANTVCAANKCHDPPCL